MPAVDVLRAAVSEVEEYARVEVPQPPKTAVVGAAATDVVHLLAELVENATLFSPPQTRVDVRALTVPEGLLIEVEDRGLGLPPAELDQLNARLAEPPEFDLAESDRLGLFVVSRLAARHGIGVRLRPSPYGGSRRR
ncbi:sensor histidine kinase [Nonomuraea recticatena]|uniref:sensor histidine kinase n=1 Tax=Nonomuraea recticatena TaxID=46178 RepID=UPI0036156EDC